MILLLLALACGGGTGKRPPGGEAVCASGYLDDDGSCVPEVCGTGTWGALGVDDATVYVDIGAAEGGDGKADAPLLSIQAGVDLAGSRGGGLVAVAAGTYRENVELSTDHVGVRLAGRCHDLVTIDASAGDAYTAGVLISTRQGEVEVAGLSVVDSNHTGVSVWSGVARLEGMSLRRNAHAGALAFRGITACPVSIELVESEVVGNSYYGVVAQETPIEITLRDVSIRDTLPDSAGRLGYGLEISFGATGYAEDLDMRGNTNAGIGVTEEGSRLELRRATVTGTRSSETVDMGYGLAVQQGASLDAEEVVLSDNQVGGLFVASEGTTAIVRSSVMRDTLEDKTEDMGRGVVVQMGGELELQGCLCTGNRGAGVGIVDAGSRVELRDCSVLDNPGGGGGIGPGVFVAAGAMLEASRCEIAGNASFGVAAQGEDSLVTLNDCIVRGTVLDDSGLQGFGVYAVLGAKLAAINCEISGNSALGISVYGDGSVVQLEDCSILDTQPDVLGWSGVGISVAEGGKLWMDGCEVGGNAALGVSTNGFGTELIMRDSSVYGTAPDPDGFTGYGVQVFEGASLAAEGCAFHDNTHVGVATLHEGSRSAFRDCVFRANPGAAAGEIGGGVSVGYGAVVTLRDCELTSPDQLGIVALHGASVEAQGCEISGCTGAGVAARDAGTSVTLLDGVIRDTQLHTDGNIGFGVQVSDGARVEIERCSLSGNTTAGVLVTDGNAAASMVDSTVTGTRLGFGWQSMSAMGIIAQGEASFEASGLTVQGNGGPGLVANNDGASLRCGDCSIIDNQFAGAVAVGGGGLTLSDTAISGTGESANLGGGVGIYAAEQRGQPAPSLAVTDSTIEDHPVAGVWVGGQGSYELVDNTISGGSGVEHGVTSRCGDGVFARGTERWDGSGGLWLQGNQISDNLGAGLLLDDAQAMLDGNSYGGNSPDLLVQDESCLTQSDDWAEAPEQEICPTWDRPPCDLAFSFTLAVAEIDEPELPPPPVAAVPLPDWGVSEPFRRRLPASRPSAPSRDDLLSPRRVGPSAASQESGP